MRTSMHGNGGNVKAADSKVIVWDEATMSNKLTLEAVEHTFQDIRDISTSLVALQWSSVEIFVMCK